MGELGNPSAGSEQPAPDRPPERQEDADSAELPGGPMPRGRRYETRVAEGPDGRLRETGVRTPEGEYVAVPDDQRFVQVQEGPSEERVPYLQGSDGALTPLPEQARQHQDGKLGKADPHYDIGPAELPGGPMQRWRLFRTHENRGPDGRVRERRVTTTDGESVPIPDGQRFVLRQEGPGKDRVPYLQGPDGALTEFPESSHDQE
jgi:hypothetical protein